MTEWTIRENEPPEWYQRFQLFYLPCGRIEGRLRKAYLLCTEMTEPERLKDAQLEYGVPEAWRTAERNWDWAKRAAAWDLHTDGLVMPTLEAADKQLKLISIDAVEGLVSLLHSPSERTRLAAIIQILDRVGLVKPSDKTPVAGNNVTADLLAQLYIQAQSELNQWSKDQGTEQSPSG